MTYQKGQSGNPKGRPPKGYMQDLEKAVRKVEKEKGVKLWVHFVRRAFSDDGVLKALTGKLLPDLKQVEGKIKVEVELIPMTTQEKLGYDKLAEELAQQEIQKQLEEGEEDGKRKAHKETGNGA